jgi:ABC-2 type transport system permease protein
MANYMTVCKKELSDQLGSKRFLLLFGLLIVLGVMSAYQGVSYIKSSSSGSFISIFTSSSSGFSFITLMVYFAPILGLALGFDAINKERSTGTLSVLLTQPVFRDSIINGKFLGGVAALSLVMGSTVGVMCGVAIPMLGFGPSVDAITRIVFFMLLTILYMTLWLAISLLFSTVFKKTTTSILASISTWLVFAFVISIAASLVASAAVPVSSFTGFQAPSGNSTDAGRMGGFGFGNSSSTSNGAMMMQNQTSSFTTEMTKRNSIESSIQSVSPTYLYTEAASSILGTSSAGSTTFGFSTASSGNPFSGPGTTASISSAWPYAAALAVAMVGCFVASYMIFFRREIRAGG